MSKKLVILGGGESGVGAALLGASLNMDVFVSDGGQLSETYKQELLDAKIAFEENEHSLDVISNADILVKSPGIPDEIPLIKELINKGLDPISEIEFASRYYDGQIVAITGTNGKTTTTGIIYHVLSLMDKRVAVGGNYGRSFARILAEEKPDIAVLEISSFQLDGIREFRPDVAILLNITPDHLDRYGYQMAAYADSKMRIRMNQREEDCFIYLANDPWIESRLPNDIDKKKNYIPVVLKEGNNIMYSKSDKEKSLRNFYLKGSHNRFNAQCAVHAAEYFEMEIAEIEKGLDTFVNLPHRMEPVREIKGVQFINDSKATNVDAVKFALEAMKGPIIWIAGGVDKGNDYQQLKALVKDKVEALLCLGIENGKLMLSFESSVETIEEFRDVNACVQRAQQLAGEKDAQAVLLSPACASFDLFKNYIDRGDQYKNAVMALTE